MEEEEGHSLSSPSSSFVCFFLLCQMRYRQVGEERPVERDERQTRERDRERECMSESERKRERDREISKGGRKRERKREGY